MSLSNTSVARYVQQNYYSKTQLNSGQLDTRYFTESEHIATSAGAGDAGKPVKLNGSGVLDSTFFSSAYVTLTGSQTLTNKTLTDPLIGRVYGSAAANGDLTLEGTSDATKTTSYVILQPTGGNVGIGISAPTDPLHVVSAGLGGATIKAANDGASVFANGHGLSILSSIFTGGLALSQGGNALSAIQAYSAGAEDGTLALNPTGGKVGVNTLSPVTVLDVNGSCRVVTDFYVVGITDTGNDGIRLSYNSNTGYIDTKASNALIFRLDDTNGGTEVARLTSAGLNVPGTITQNSVAVVTTTGSQTLTNKTLTTPTISGTGFANANHTHLGSSSGGLLSHYSSTATHGVTGDIVGTTDSQTLTNKTLTSPAMTGPTADTISMSGTTFRLANTKTPSSAIDTGTKGDHCWDGNYFYICTGTNTWRRVAHATW